MAVSCKVGPNYKTPSANIAEQWSQNPSTNNSPPVVDVYWWRAFNDPVLDRLITNACRNNLSLQIAGVHVLETRARLNKSIGDLFPQQQGISGQLNYSRLNGSLGSKIVGINPNYFSSQLLFGATWEIDFWGKYRRSIESDRANFLNSIVAYDDAMVTVIADVASIYINIRTLQERLQVATQNLEAEQEGLRIATARYEGGETSELDMQQAKTQCAQTAAQIPLLNEAIIQYRNALAVLLGVRPDEIAQQLTGEGIIPATPTNITVGIPRDLLRRRPDIREAGLQAASYSALIGVAKASMYPAFSLSGEFGVSANNEFNASLLDMFNWQSRVINAGAGVVMPILNYGRLKNQVRAQDALFEQAVLKYRNTVLAAQQEVENGLASFSNEQIALVSLNEAAISSRRSSEIAMVQYKSGQTDYTTVLAAEQAELAVENNVAITKGNVALGLISIYRALGGGWEVRGTNDVISDAVKAEMSRRTDWGRMLKPEKHLPKSIAAAPETKGNP